MTKLEEKFYNKFFPTVQMRDSAKIELAKASAALCLEQIDEVLTDFRIDHVRRVTYLKQKF